MAFYDRLKEARVNAGLTQEQLAEKLGVAKSTLSGYESGNREPTVATIAKALKILNIDANFLYQDEMDALGGSPVKLKYNEMKLIEKYRSLDNHGREMIDFTLEKEWERSTSINQLTKDIILYHHNDSTLSASSMVAENIIPYGVDAAHERTDIDVTNEMRKHDDRVMDSDDF